MMDAGRWELVKRLFEAALGRPASDRAAFVQTACGADPELQREVESLLAAHADAGRFAEQPPVAATSASVAMDGGPSGQEALLQPGARIGAYEIRGFIASGGMGDVYRAHDRQLRRDVALKILPVSFAADRDRVARFEREARLLAALNHPHIAAIYGCEQQRDVAHGGPTTPALVLEFVEGPTLAERLTKGALPINEALEIARQIGEALEAAHEKGIVHRDLKPANVKVTSDGTVKVLDFGLARAFAGDGGTDLSQLPTLTVDPTREGVIAGTPAYMSPEQARGQAVDKRTDIWAFGCVLYEMLAGRPAFHGDTLSETLADVLKSEPRWEALPREVPAALAHIVRRCLHKDPRQRMRDIGDVRVALEWAFESADSARSTTVTGTRRRERLPWVVAAAVVVLAAAVASVPYFRGIELEAPPVRFTISAPENGLLNPAPAFLAVSPDGSRLAFIATDSIGRSQLWIRALDSLAAQPLLGTEGALQPFWSPDGRFLAFFADGSLKKIAISGGPAQTLTGGLPGIQGGTWSHEGVVLFAVAPGGGNTTVQRVSAAGGAPTPVTTLDTSRQEGFHAWPHFLPDGKHFLYFAGSPTRPENNTIYVGSLDSKERTVLLSAASNAVYAPPGYVLYDRAGTLLAQPFDAGRIQLTGEPIPIAEGLQFNPANGRAAFANSENGVLAYRSEIGTPPRTLVWVTRNGSEQPLAAPARMYDAPRVSPDGRRVVVEIGVAADTQGFTQLWVYDLARDTLTRLTFEGSNNHGPVWTPDGKRIAFYSDREGLPTKIFWQLADSSGGLERLTSGGENGNQVPSSWSADGQLLAFHEPRSTTQRDIWVFRLSDRKVEPFLRTPFVEGGATFSPDGRWLAYVSNESGRPEVYVQPYPGPGGKWLISTDGGTEPAWNRDGRELFYRSGNQMMVVETTTQPSFSAGKPRMLFDRQYFANSFPAPSAVYDVSPDGQRFLMLKQGEQFLGQITVVQNWSSDVKRLVPAR